METNDRRINNVKALPSSTNPFDNRGDSLDRERKMALSLVIRECTYRSACKLIDARGFIDARKSDSALIGAKLKNKWREYSGGGPLDDEPCVYIVQGPTPPSQGEQLS